MPEDQQPPQWSQPTQYIVLILLFVASVAFLFYTRELVASLLIAAIITYVLNPLSRLFEFKLGLSHRRAAGAAYAIFIAAIVSVLAGFTPVAIDRVTALTQDFESLVFDVEQNILDNADMFGVDLPMQEWIDNFNQSSIDYLVPSNLLSVFTNVSANFVWVLIVFVTVFYLLQDWTKLRDWAILQVPPYRRDDFVRLYLEVKLVWQAYLRGQLVLMTVVGLLSWLGAAAVGLRGAWAVGLLAGILDVIPSVGPAIAAMIGIVVAFFTGSTYIPVSNLVFAIIVLSIFVLVQGIENIWLRPRILGNSLRIHPALVFIGVMSSLAVAGVFVTLFIVPLMGTVGVLWYYLRARMLGIDPWPDDMINNEALMTLAHATEIEVRSVTQQTGNNGKDAKSDKREQSQIV